MTARPVRLWNVEDEETALGATPSPDATMARVDVALSAAPTVEGCASDATRCGAGTRIRTRGMDLQLFADHTLERSDGALVVRQVDLSEP